MRLFDDRDFRAADARAGEAKATGKNSALQHGSAASGVRGRIKAVYEMCALYSGWFVFGSICLVASFFAGFLRYVLPRKFGNRLGQRMVTLCFHLFLIYLAATRLVKCDVSALDELKYEKGLILAPNHPSLIDAVLVMSRLPRVTCIMKAVLWDNIVLGGGARLAGFVRNDSQPNMVRASVAALRDGGQLLMFPEGTRTVELPINPLKGAIALIAKKAQAPVQTIFIESNSEFLGKHWPTLKKPQFPLHYRVTLGKRFDPPMNDKAADNKIFVAELDAYFRAELSHRHHDSHQSKIH
jgi:1-acyl-sn-glycerol-3-phosphate acyltransferase